MAQLVNVRLSRGDASPWGFRLQGGKDFGQPLLIQKVNGGSLAERAGLQVGDALIKVNNVEVHDMRHKDAQDTLVRAGNSIELTVQRGGMGTWKPSVTPVGQLGSPGAARSPQTVTKTSLAAKPSSQPIPSGHNVSPRPFAGTPQLNGGNVKAIVNKQYNSPVNIYSEENIAETLSAQSEVLAGGAIGVNFMKNEKTYDSQHSEVFKMVQEVEKEPREPEPELTPSLPATNFPSVTGLRHVAPPEAKPPTSPQTILPPGQNICADCERLIVDRRKEASTLLQIVFDCMKPPLSNAKYFSMTSHAVGGRATSPRPLTPIARSMGTPELPQDKPYMPPPSPMPGSPQCTECGKHIVGVFVRIKDKNLHVECFKCATCGSSLKNVGYYNVNNKLYCDIHAKMAAKQAPPAPNLEPVTIPPGARIPTGTFSIPSIPSAPLAGPKSPQPGTIAPLPFHAPRSGTRHVVFPPPSFRLAPRYYGGKTSNTPGPKPFGSSIAPSTPTSVPFSMPSTPPTPSNFPKPEPSRVVWPPATQSPNVSQAPIDKKKQTKKNFDIPVVKCEDVDECKSGKRMSVCSEEVCQLSSKCTSVCQTQGRPISPVAEKLRGRSPTRKVTRNSQSIQMSEKYESKMGQQRIEIYSPVPRSPSADYLDVSSKPHGLRPYQSAAIERPLSPAHVVVFPPQIPDVLPRSRSATPQPRRTPQPKPERKAQRDRSHSPSQAVEHAPVKSEPFPKSRSPSPNPQMIQYQKVKSENVEQLQRKTSQENSCRAIVEYRSFTPSPIPMEKEKPKAQKKPPEKTKEHLFTKEEVEKIVQEELKKLLQKPQEKKEEPVSCYDLPKPIIESGNMASALSVAPDRPFTPVPFPTPLELPSVVQQQIPQIKKEPVPLPPETAPYFPPEPPPPQKEKLDDRTARACREVGVRSPMTEALTIAPDRAYSPLPHQVDAKSFKPIQGRKQSVSMLSALTVAPTVPFTVPGMTPIPPKCETPTVPKIQVKSEAPYVPHHDIKKQAEPVKKPEEPVKKEKYGVDRSLVYEGGKTKELIKSFESASSKSSNASYERKSEYLSEHTKSMHPPKGRKTPVITKPDPAGLLSPSKLPYYQQNIGEIPVRNRSISPVPHRICAPTIHPQSPLAIQESHKTMQKHHSSYSGKTNQGFVSGKEASLAQTEYKSEISKLASTTQDIKKEEARRLIGEKTAYGIRHPESLSHSQQNLCETPEMQSPVAFSSQKYMSQQQSKHLTQQNQQQGYFSKTYSESSTSSSKSMSKSVKTITTTTKTDKIIEDRQQLTPSPWKGTYVKAVQTLSPITVRLPSPQPPPLKPKGELSQQTSASVVVKPKPKGSSTMASSNSKTTTSQSYNQSQCSTGGKQGCGESKGCGEKKGCGENKGCGEKQGCGDSKGCGEKQGCGDSKGCGEKQGCGERKGCGEKCNNPCSQNSVCCQTSETQCCEETSFESQYQQRKVNGAVTVAPSNYQFTPQGNIWTPACMSNTSSTNVVSGSRSSAFTSVNKNQSVIQKSTGALGVRQTYPPPNPILSQTLPKTYTPTNPGFCVVDPSSSTPNAGGGGIGGGIGGGLGGGIGGLGGSLGGGIPGGLGGGRSGTAGSTAPKRGRGVLNAAVPAGGRIPLCGHCNNQIRGPFITALGKIWCPDHFTCSNAKCKRPLQDIGFVEEQDGLYCEFCFEQYLAPTCSKCNAKIKGDCLNAIGKHFHPQCFCCAYCDKLFGNNLFFLEDGLPYCENDWNELFTTKCIACGFPIEAGDRWVEALNNNYHSKCFNCTMCKKNLEGQSFFAKGGRPYCKTHAR